MYIVKVDNKEFRVEIERGSEGFNVLLDGKRVKAEVIGAFGGGITSRELPVHLSLIVENKVYDVVIENKDTISVDGERFRVKVEDEMLSYYCGIGAKPKVEHAEEVAVRVPMPGLVIEVEVAEGDKVKAGDGLVIIEAMKMQNEMKAPRDGIVRQVAVKKGMAVNGGDTLVIIE